MFRSFWLLLSAAGSRSFWLLLSAAGAAAKFSCLDESGDAVDHFYVLKGNAGSDAYLLVDGDDAFQAANSFDSSSNAVVRTLKQIYGTLPSSHAFTLYNDETDEGEASRHAAPAAAHRARSVSTSSQARACREPRIRDSRIILDSNVLPRARRARVRAAQR